MSHEYISYPISLSDQERIVRALDLVYEEIHAYERHLNVMESLRRAGMAELLLGRRIPASESEVRNG